MSEESPLKFDPSELNIITTELPPTKYDESLQLAYQRSLDAVTKGEDDGWVFNTEKAGIRIWVKTPPDGSSVDYYKGVGRIKGHPEEVRSLVVNLSTRREWDDIYSSGHTVEQIDPNTYIQYISFGAPWPISTRDFCTVVRSQLLPTGEIMVFYGNAEHPECPEIKGNVRGDLHFSVFLIKPLDDGMCEVTYSAGNNPKGSIPRWLVNLSTTQQPLLINALGDTIKTKPDVVKKAVEEQREDFMKMKKKLGLD